MPVSIYVIIDPRDQEPLYVGATDDVEARKKAHLERAKKFDTMSSDTLSIDEYINGMQKLGHEPEFEVLEDIEDETQAEDAEKKWIKDYTEKGKPLLNAWVEFRLIMLEKFNREQIQAYFKARLDG